MATDKSEPATSVLAIIGVMTVIGLFLTVFTLLAFYDNSLQKTEELNGASVNTSLVQLHNDEDSKLLSYAVDPATGKIQIPIRRAMELEAQKPWRPNTPRPTPTPTPLPGQTPVPTPAPVALGATPPPAAATTAPPAAANAPTTTTAAPAPGASKP